MRTIVVKALLILLILGPAAAMTPYLVATVLTPQTIAASPSRTIDGSAADWLAQKPLIANAAILATNGSETEWVWRDKIGDARDDFSAWNENKANWDIEQIRMIGDGTYLYILVEVDWFRGWVGAPSNNFGDDMFLFNIAVDAEIASDPNGGTGGMDWIGDQSFTNGPPGSTLLGNAAQYAEVNLSLCKSGIYKFTASPWVKVGDYGTDIALHQANGLLEARIKWTDLGYAGGGVPPRLRFTMASAYRKHWGAASPEDDDKTVAMPPGTGSSSDMLDAVTLGLGNYSSVWRDELNDGSIGFYVDVAFRNDGNCANLAPAPPTNLRAYCPVQKRWCESGDTILTNNPLFAWDLGGVDADAGDTVVSYYIQVCTGSAVGGDGFFHYNPAVPQAITANAEGIGPDNRILWLNNFTAQPWWGPADSKTGIPNAIHADTPYLQMGQTYYIRVWSRDRRGVLSAASPTFTLPIDYPVWHDPYAFQSFGDNKSTYRGNRDPKEGSDVAFMVGVWDTSPMDPGDFRYYMNAPINETAPNEILNITLHIRVAKAGHPSYDAPDVWTNARRALLGNEREWGGINRYYRPNVAHPSYGGDSDPVDTQTIWKTGGTITAGFTPTYDQNAVNLGTSGGANVVKLDAKAGDTVEYFFEINNPYEAPTGGAWRQSRAPRRFLIAYDANGITGYRMGTWEEAVRRPFRFVVQNRDLTAVWHNPLSTEVPLGPGGDTLAMRTPMWPDTSPQTVKMYVGCIGWGGMGLQMVWRNVDSGGWTTTNFSGGNGTLVDASSVKYYYVHNFNYTGGMIEYYFKANSDDLYIFANGITSRSDTVFDNSLDSIGVASIPFRFPFTSRVKMTSRASTGKDTHSIVAVLGFKAPRFDAMNRNAIGVNGVLDLRTCSTSVVGNGFANAFPGSQISLNHEWDSAEPRLLIGRSYFALLTATSNAITGIRKAFFGPIYPIDYPVSDTTKWNTGSDAYENVPILNYEEVFSEVVDRTEAAGTVFGAGEPLEGTVYVPGNSTVNTVAVTQGALIADGSITIPAGQVVTGERLDLCALGGPLTINGTVDVETGIAFSNQTVIIGPTGKLRIRRLGTMTAQAMTADTGSEVHINHPASMSFSATKESVLARATRWVISALRETRR